MSFSDGVSMLTSNVSNHLRSVLASCSLRSVCRLTDTVQIHKDALDENDVVLLHDDLLATGGTMKAACELVKKLKPKKVYINFIIELKDLNGKSVFGDDVEVESVLTL